MLNRGGASPPVPVPLLLGAAFLLSSCTNSAMNAADAGSDAPGLSAQVQHILFFLKENRTFDNYFGTFPGADGVQSATASDGKVYPLAHQPDSIRGDINPSSASAQKAYDGGKMDQFDLMPTGA